MNLFNRVIMVLLFLTLMVITILVAIVPEQSLRLAGAFFEWARQTAAYYNTSSQWPLFAAGRVLISGVIALICLIVIWLEVRKPRRKSIRVQKATGGEAHVTIDSVAQRLAYNLDRLPDVIKVTPRIFGRARTMDIELLLETSPDIEIPAKTEEVLQITREIVEERMGLKLGKVQVKIKHAPYPKEQLS